jgi:hypothetical protein
MGRQQRNWFGSLAYQDGVFPRVYWRGIMIRYMLHIFCDECATTHSMNVSVALPEGPSAIASVGELYPEHSEPSNISVMLRNAVKCPKTGKYFQQRDNNKIYIAPMPGM